MPSLKLGIDAGDHLIVEIIGRHNEYDDWLATTISIRAGSFVGSFDAALLTCDFPPFRRQLEHLHKWLESVARFDTIEGQLTFECVGNGLGGVMINGVAQDRAGDGNQLRFQFDIDQTYLPKIIAEIRRIESEFPSRIQPEFPQ